MNLAIVHYHLNRGGVARVIENHLAGLDAALDAVGNGDKPWRVAVLYGGRCEGFDTQIAERLRQANVSLEVVPLLEYDDATGDGSEPDALFQQIVAMLQRLNFEPGETVVHVHNHSLGKNRAMPGAIRRLAETGHGLLLQVHDFAEDFRPTNYAQVRDEPMLYPQAPSIHYAALNGRDRDILRTAGMEPNRLHLLPNPVPEPVNLPERRAARERLLARFGVEADAQFVLYPVRGIRRKNLGEMLLYSALAPEGTVVGLTLAPLNPTEQPIYAKWKELAAELQLPCLFETGAPDALSFEENLAAADVILTTSLAEGFGMVFLEAWLAGRPLVGRDLPEITPDFQQAGLCFDRLWDRLQVPLDWIGTDTFLRVATEKYRRTLEAYGLPEPANVAEQLRAKIVHNPDKSALIDFGDLDEPMQERVIRTVHADGAKRRLVLEYNPILERAVNIRPAETEQTVRRNAQSVRQHFSLLASGQRLVTLYEQIASNAGHVTVERLSGIEQIVDRFLRADRFRMTRG